MIGIGVLGAVFALGLGVGAAPAQTTTAVAGETDLAAFRRLRTEGMAARQAGDLAQAERSLAAAERHLPNHPGVIVLRARIAAEDDRPDDAIRQLELYAAAGLTADLTQVTALAPLLASPAGASISEAQRANGEPVGAAALGEIAAIPGSGLVEAIVRDPANGRWLVSQVRGRTILALSDDGTVTPWLADDPERSAVVGLAIDPARGVLWAATMALPPATHGRLADAAPVEPALLRIDLDTAAVVQRYALPDGATERGAGDVALGPDGTVYVANPVGGDLFRLRPAAEALEVMRAPGVLGSPQGMVAGDDGALIVADYSSGIWRVGADGSTQRLAAPSDAVLIGVDGLIDGGDALYAIQNGTAPQRVLRLTLSAGRDRIEATEVLAANLPRIDEPTTGLIHEGDLVFVSRSQWSAFDGEGALREPEPAPALISRLRLPPRSAP
ncbi:hypothetical protein [Brevundimonas aurifodinae]